MGRLKVRNYIAFLVYLLVQALSAQPKDVLERVFVHPNSQVFVAGETLRFSAYTLSHLSGKVVDKSKMLYVQLIGKEGTVMEQKLAISQGRGSGEFFINSLLPTGRYQLLAYTRWMRNFEDYFQLPITIINPFETEIPESRIDSTYQIKFFHPNGYLVDGIQTRVGFRIQSPGAGQDITAGKLIDSNGNVIQEFTPNEYGMGYFIVQPEAAALYRVLLEDESGSISFHDFLPIEEAGYGLEVQQQARNITVTPRTVNRPSEDLTLIIYFAGDVWSTKHVVPNERITFKWDALPPEVFQVVLVASGQPVYSSSVFPSQKAGIIPKFSGLKDSYGVRDSLKLQVDLPAGNYSVSIHQLSQQLTATNIKAEQGRLWSLLRDPLVDRPEPPLLSEDPKILGLIQDFRVPKPIPDSVSLLPELRNELIQANLRSTAEKSVANVEVALAFPGQVPQVKTSFTDENGKVVFHYRPMPLTQETAFLSALDHQLGWEFVVEEKFLTDFPPFDYSLAPIDSLTAIEIKKRSINNQIMNAFDKLSPPKPTEPNESDWQFTQWDFEYTLDDYQRFDEFKTYFIEYIMGAGLRGGGIQVRKAYFRPDFKQPPLVLLDGVPVSRQGVLELDPYLVERVSVLMNRTYLGPSVFDGVVYIETYENDLAGYAPVSAQEIAYQGVSANSQAIRGPHYLASQHPDRRIHLYWDPALSWDGGLYHFSGITSDVTGIFEIRIEGFTEDGEPISIRESIQVKR